MFTSTQSTPLGESDVKWQADLSSTFSVIDKDTWARVGIEVTDVPPLNRGSLEKLVHTFMTLGIEDRYLEGHPRHPIRSGVTLLLMPSGLTFKTLVDISRGTKAVSKTLIKCPPPAQELVESLSIPSSYWVLISDSVLTTTRKMSASAQREFLREHQCDLPSALEVLARNILKYVLSADHPRYLFGKHLWSFTQCREQLHATPDSLKTSCLSRLFHHDRNCSLIVGGTNSPKCADDRHVVDLDYYDSTAFGAAISHKVD